MFCPGGGASIVFVTTRVSEPVDRTRRFTADAVSEDPRPDGALRRHRLLTDEAELELRELSIQLPVADNLPPP